ncbi:hypothetical protein KSP40_PGU003348 [Platanthera guangdongensis]|uniref:Polygalacturonase n=1 Tax=Platanthera guangdongensis TaxID=2320717 RepID=A0ABR2N4A0_9ASPA
MAILFCQGIKVEGATITVPGHSPNTDGIHNHRSTGVSITGSTIATGDDCISFRDGVDNAWMENINCGPGHGISMGSLGNSAGKAGVQNVTVSSVVFSGTQWIQDQDVGHPLCGLRQEHYFSTRHHEQCAEPHCD